MVLQIVSNPTDTTHKFSTWKLMCRQYHYRPTTYFEIMFESTFQKTVFNLFQFSVKIQLGPKYLLLSELIDE